MISTSTELDRSERSAVVYSKSLTQSLPDLPLEYAIYGSGSDSASVCRRAGGGILVVDQNNFDVYGYDQNGDPEVYGETRFRNGDRFLKIMEDRSRIVGLLDRKAYERQYGSDAPRLQRIDNAQSPSLEFEQGRLYFRIESTERSPESENRLLHFELPGQKRYMKTIAELARDGVARPNFGTAIEGCTLVRQKNLNLIIENRLATDRDLLRMLTCFPVAEIGKWLEQVSSLDGIQHTEIVRLQKLANAILLGARAT